MSPAQDRGADRCSSGILSVEVDFPYGRRWVVLRILRGELGGELQSVHQGVGLAFVDAGFAKGITDLCDGELDASGLFDGGQLQAVVGVLGAVQGYVELLMAVAVGHAP